MQLNVEYLIIIQKEATEALYHLCDGARGFNKLLQSDSLIKIERNQIAFQKTLKCAYQVTAGNVQGKQQRFFHLRVTFDGGESQIDDFIDLLRVIKGIFYRVGIPPETLWDDVSLFYSEKTYPLIHKIENLMRKLITYFMLTNVGKQWVSENLPKGIEDAIEKSKRKQYLDALYQVDFIHLGESLFNLYPTKKVVEDLFSLLETAQSPDELDLNELRGFVPESNWDRYFSGIVECDDRYLKTRWDKLYELRCKVAHNAIFSRGDYNQVCLLVGEVKEKLQKALDNLDKVHVPEEDKEQVAENVASSLSALYGEFIQAWKKYEATLQQVSTYLGIIENRKGLIIPRRIIHKLHKDGLVDDDFVHETDQLSAFRNQLVHDPNLNVSEQNIHQYIERLDIARSTVLSLTSGKSSWRDEVINALQDLGGRATLSELYDYIQKNTSRELPETWKATVRYTLQTNSSSSKAFRSGKDVFVRLDRGYWALRNNSDEQEAE